MGEGGREMSDSVWDRVWNVDMGEEEMGDVRLCLGLGVDMGEGGWEMCCCV